MPTKPQAAVWDSCVVIDAIHRDKTWWPKIEPLIVEARSGDAMIVVSEFTVAEVFQITKLQSKDVTRDEAIAMLDDWFNQPYIDRRPVDREITKLSAQFSRDFGLMPADAVMAATAVFWDIPVLYTRDGNQKKPKQCKLLPCDGKLKKPNGHPLIIKTPDGVAKPTPTKSAKLFEEPTND